MIPLCTQRKWRTLSRKNCDSGPNGSGKTTLAREFLPKEAACPRFINVDLIAEGLSPFNPEIATFQAGRLMVQEIANCVRRGESFAFETTLSGLRYARLIPQWRKKGYFVKLIFLKLPSPEMAIARVAQGGHAVAETIIRRRFLAGWRNFQQIYRPLVNTWILYNNALDRPEYVNSEGEINGQ